MSPHGAFCDVPDICIQLQQPETCCTFSWVLACQLAQWQCAIYHCASQPAQPLYAIQCLHDAATKCVAQHLLALGFASSHEPHGESCKKWLVLNTR